VVVEEEEQLQVAVVVVEEEAVVLRLTSWWQSFCVVLPAMPAGEKTLMARLLLLSNITIGFVGVVYLQYNNVSVRVRHRMTGLLIDSGNQSCILILMTA
jgi:hypothetical protein